ncbi:hypothetical protein HK101_011404 [Irineochytrium annulatum]|nr:hypothetical protein HK101_011404 [Irineochytrium annulatum]
MNAADDGLLLEDSGPDSFRAVLKRDDTVVGCLNIKPLHKRPGYKHSARVELQTDVDAAEIAAVLGRLLTTVHPRCSASQIRVLACLFPTAETAVIAAFLANGFRRVMALQGVSVTADGASEDIVVLQKDLAPAFNRPVDAVDWFTHLGDDMRAVLDGQKDFQTTRAVWDPDAVVSRRRDVSAAYDIRDATVDDVQGTLNIYVHEVLTSTVTADLHPPSLEDRHEWFKQFGEGRAGGRGRPLLVAIDRASGLVAGFCGICQYGFAPGCDTTGEITLYIHHLHHRRGLGRALVHELLCRLKAAGYREVIAAMSGGNVASVALFSGFGFKHVGVITDSIYKFDTSVDHVAMQLSL